MWLPLGSFVWMKTTGPACPAPPAAGAAKPNDTSRTSSAPSFMGLSFRRVDEFPLARNDSRAGARFSNSVRIRALKNLQLPAHARSRTAWKHQVEPTAAARLLDAEPAAVELDETLRDRETESAPSRTSRKRSARQQLPQLVEVDASAAVVDQHGYLVRIRDDTDVDDSPVVRAAQRVVEQIAERALEMQRRRFHLGLGGHER